MRDVTTDYLVVGAGASALAFADALVRHTDDDLVLVDRRHAPGGHWLDAYPFVRLHQPSAYYGVASRPLGQDRVDQSGPNAGFYERAGAAEICAYFEGVLHDLLATGRVRFLALSDHEGEDRGVHHVVSTLDGSRTEIRVRRRLVDATYVQSEIPSRHTPAFAIEPGARLLPPNDLVHIGEPVERVTVIGAGKTASDTVTWLLDIGLDADRIRWIRPRDPWWFDRAFTQPLEQVAGYLRLQASWLAAAAASGDGREFAHRLEDAGIFVRIDPSVEPQAFRGATISRGEIDGLRTVENVVRTRVRGVGPTAIHTDDGELPVAPRELVVDCTAAGVRATERRPVFEPSRITIQYVTVGFLPWSAATIAVVESLETDDATKNAFCPPVAFSGHVADVLELAYDAMRGEIARTKDATLAAWSATTRLNPARGALGKTDDPDVAEGLASIAATAGDAMRNLHARTQAAGPG